MPLQAPETSYSWLRIPARGQVQFVVVGEVHTWWSHWVCTPGGRRGQCVRCLAADGGDCRLCDQHFDRRVRYVMPVRVDQVLHVLELGRVQYPRLAQIYEGGRWVGSRWRAWRAYESAQAAIEVLCTGHEQVDDSCVVDLADYVASLGLSSMRLVDMPRANPSKPSPNGSMLGAGKGGKTSSPA